MKTPADLLASRYRLAHNEMRNIDGLQPSEALDELLKYLLYRAHAERADAQQPVIDVFSDKRSIRTAVQSVKEGLTLALNSESEFVRELFRYPHFALSDACIAKLHEILGPVDFAGLGFDVRSAALRTFLGADIRKGLGIFLTPDEVVTEICRFFDFAVGDHIADPASGSGTFLMAAHAQAITNGVKIRATGVDKSPRMMLLALLNIGNNDDLDFTGLVADTLRHSEYSERLPFDSVDYVITNPPFGVNVDHESYDLHGFTTAMTAGRGARKQSSELLFVEQSLRLLKPDGWLAIVLPKSAINTSSGEYARHCLDRLGAVRALVDLPAETFAATGTMTNTVVLFVQKFGRTLTPLDSIQPLVMRLDNVGFDNTGRIRGGSQLPGLGRAMRLALDKGTIDPRIEILRGCAAGQTFSTLPQIAKGQSGRTSGRQTLKLAEIVEKVSTGTTPPRASYASEGLFLVKVGNLTGAGINWIARDRNFVDASTAGRRYAKDGMVLRPGDILLTSSAHSPKYIAKKIDIISIIPDWAGGQASYVGEVMLIRPDHAKVDPYRLTAYLRLPAVVDEIQRMIRGQTAHLHPQDVLDLDVDAELLFDSQLLTELADLVREEAAIAERLNQISWKQMTLADRLLDQPSDTKLVA